MAMLRIVLAALLIPPAAAAAAGPDTEYKVVVAAGSVDAARAAFGLAPDGKKENVYFFDTPGFSFYARGTILRARASGKKGDATVKMRPAPDYIPPEIASDPGFRCEYDRGMYGYAYSCSLKGRETGASVEAAAAGTAGPETIFSGNRALWLGEAPWRAMRAYGPVRAESWKQSRPEFGELAFEAWAMPGGARVFEISFRADERTVEEKIRLFSAELARLGIQPSGDQTSKTAAAFRAFGAPAGGL